jgi:nicotinate-nucleotide adenylyltransferase
MNVAIMGGTFDPPHLAHVLPIEAAKNEFQLDVVWFVPALIPPHKLNRNRTDPFHRTAMLALALKPFPAFKISTMELMRGDISFTVNTVREFHSKLNAEDRLFFILGSDSFLELNTWYEPAQLLGLCELIIISRGDAAGELLTNLEQLEKSFRLDLKNKVHFASHPHLPYSSTEIRKRIEEGKSVSVMLNPDVDAYIQKHSLYRR